MKKLISMTILLGLILGSINLAQASTGQVKYTYDDFYRLIKVENPDGSIVNFTYDLLGNRKTMVTTAPTIGGCVPPASGDWVVTSSCTYTANLSSPANVIVQNNAVLTIANGAMLNIDMHNFALRVKSGSGVLIKAGGKIY